MSASLLLLFNHTATAFQEEDARRSLGAEEIIHLPDSLKPIWNRVPPEHEAIRGYLEPIRRWVAENAKPQDYILIEGDFGATYLMVKFAFENGLIPIYSTTDRDAAEEHDPRGTVRMVHHFKHCRFRKYGV